ncbi:MAG: hypothetical protein ACTHMU_16350, partial [Thermomicrobiales bacterium]
MATRERAGPRQPMGPRVGAFALATVARCVNGVFGGQCSAVPMLWQWRWRVDALALFQRNETRGQGR